MLKKIGVDLGGTKIEAALLDEDLHVITRKRVGTPGSYTDILNSISELVLEISHDTSEYTLGVCTPGAISKQTGLIKNSNTQALIGKPLKEDLERLLGKKVSMENDANCFALAEATMGAASNYNLVFGVILGTGVGGGIIIDKKLHQGRTNIGGEWGHHTLHRNGNPCYCGKTGCIETYISGPALEGRWAKLTGKSLPLVEILSCLDGELGQSWKNDFLENFGYGLANVIDILDPDAIVLGGGLSNIDFLYTLGVQSIYEKVFSDSIDTPILKNKLGDSAGVFGACMI